MTPEIEMIARELADAITERRFELKQDLDAGSVFPRPTEVRSAAIDGMVTGLTFVIGCPGDFDLAEAFIKNAPYWRALLPITSPGE
jgi:hypothetical protein